MSGVGFEKTLPAASFKTLGGLEFGFGVAIFCLGSYVC